MSLLAHKLIPILTYSLALAELKTILISLSSIAEAG